MLKLGIIGHSFKENEKRVPVHPNDFHKITERYREYIYIDHDYGINYGYSDEQLAPYVAGIINKEDMYKFCDVILVLKYTYDDYLLIDTNKICWGKKGFES